MLVSDYSLYRSSLAAMLDEDEEDRVDETALQQLTEMGFPESRAVKALRLNQWVFFILVW